jgi:hypothetical protein
MKHQENHKSFHVSQVTSHGLSAAT